MPSKSRSRSSSSAPASTGILGGVLNFVSREFESFVANATANTSFAASSSRRTLDDDGDDDEYDDEEEEEEEVGHRRRARYSRHRSPTPPPRKRKSKSRRYSPTPSPPPREIHNKHRERRDARSPSPRFEDRHDERQQDTRPVRLPPNTAASQRCLKRKMSSTMPGSLFPRSPSMEPSELDATRYHEQHVRFAAPSTPADNQGQRARRNSTSLMPPPAIYSSPGGTPRKSPLAPTIKAVVNRFHVGEGDADPSILLPSPNHSPEALTRSTRRSLDKGKARAIGSDDEFLDPNVSGVLRVKGKERELSTMREDLEQREQRMMDHQGGDMSFQLMEEERNMDKERIHLLEEEIARLKQELAVSRSSGSASYPPPPPAPPPPPLFAPPKKTLIPTAGTDDINMFASVRSHLKHAPPPVEKPINPATGRRPGKPTIGLTADQMAAFLTEMKTVRLRKVVDKPEAIADRSYRAPSPLRSSRSFPRPSSRASLPHRLSKGDSSFENSGSEREGLARSTSFLQRVPRKPAAAVDNSASEQESSTKRGEKRKEAPGDDEHISSRRRVSSSLDNSFSSTGSNGSFTQSETLPPPSVTESMISTTTSRQASSSRWQSSSVTDAPTPSLCSDNEQETSPDDIVPSTPPAATAGPSRGFYRFRGKGVPVDDSFDRSTYDHDVSMNEPDHEPEDAPQPEPEPEEEPEDEPLPVPEPEPPLPEEPEPLEPSPRIQAQAPPRQPKSLTKKTSMIPRPVHRPRGNLFDHRPPSSPMPANSPRRPKPPSRASKTAPRSDDDDDIDAPLAMTFSPAPETFNLSRRASQNTPNPIIIRQQHSSSAEQSTRSRTRKPLPKSPHPNKTRVQDVDEGEQPTHQRRSRRHTLEQEIREAELPPTAREILDDYEDYEEEVLTAVGTRDNHGGFLAHGGAGGPAVFMGVGYVQGAREIDGRLQDDHDEYHPASDEDDDEYVPTPPRSRRR